jgi:hypothetical protein
MRVCHWQLLKARGPRGASGKWLASIARLASGGAAASDDRLASGSLLASTDPRASGSPFVLQPAEAATTARRRPT